MPIFYRRICDFCEEPYEGRGKRFCSPECLNDWQRQKGLDFNVATLRKRELIAFNTKKCKHGELYSAHPRCFQKEYLEDKKCKIGFFDIETTNFNADVGMFLSYCIKEKGESKIWYALGNRKDQDKSLDKKIVEQLAKDLNRFDKIVTYYGTCFDIPFARARALKWQIKFTPYGLLQHKDVYYMVKSKLKITHKSQQKACEIIFGESRKTRFNPEVWLKATRGDKKSLARILDHNKRDVRDLERLFDVMMNFVKGGSKSI